MLHTIYAYYEDISFIASSQATDNIYNIIYMHIMKGIPQNAYFLQHAVKMQYNAKCNMTAVQGFTMLQTICAYYGVSQPK